MERITLAHPDGRTLVIRETEDGGVIEESHANPKTSSTRRKPRHVEISPTMVQKNPGGPKACMDERVKLAKAKDFVEQNPETFAASSEKVSDEHRDKVLAFLREHGWEDHPDIPTAVRKGESQVSFVARERSDGPSNTMATTVGETEVVEGMVALTLMGKKQAVSLVDNNNEEVDHIKLIKEMAREDRIDKDLMDMLYEQKVLVDITKHVVSDAVRSDLFTMTM